MGFVDRSKLPVRIIRLKPGEPWPNDDLLDGGLTMEERIALVWPLTQQIWAIAGEPIATPGIQRDVVHIVRGRR